MAGFKVITEAELMPFRKSYQSLAFSLVCRLGQDEMI
jgi:hypothetical protein